MTHIRAVLFDMDGVLFDSMPYHARCWAEVCRAEGLDLTAEEAYLHEGRTAKGTIDLLARRCWGRDATNEEVQRIYDAKQRLFNALPEAPRMDGADEALRVVRQAGMLVTLVTGSGQQSLLGRLETAYPGCFTPERMVTSDDVTHGKPDPEPYLKGLAKTGVSASEAIVVENAPLGVEAAVRAGIYTVAVNTGPLPESALREAGASVVLPSMRAFAAAFPEIVANL
ncbi:MAG: HAD-IA family hydrolase [Bacteroidaceae bacterium]|nr:HAD-IA family hydrolase [Bacteroidaceae bacterium]